MSRKQTLKTMATGTMLMTVTSLIVKILSAMYRVPFQNIVGNEGFYIYQQVYPLYGVGMTIALTGIPVYLSKILIEYQDDRIKQRSILRQLYTLMLIICLVIAVLLFLFSQNIATLMGDKQLTPLIQVVSILFLFAPLLALYRGVYQGEMTLVPTAYSQLVEQSVRVVVIICGAYVLTLMGQNDYVIGTVAMSGSLFGAVGALVVLVFYRQYKTVDFTQSFFKPVPISRQVIQRFIKECLVMCLFVSFLLVFQLVDSFIVKNQLVASGMGQLASKELKGVYDRGQPLVQLGLVVTNVFISAFLPVLTKYWTEKKNLSYQRTTSLMLKALLLVSSAATIGMMVLMPQINTFLFGSAEGNVALVIFAISVFLMSLLQGFQGILQSQNRIKTLWMSLLAGLVVKIVVTWVATYYWQIAGASVGTISGLLTANLVFVAREHRQFALMNAKSFLGRFFTSLLLFTVILISFETLAIHYTEHRFLAGVLAVLGSLIGGIIYLGLLLKMKVLTAKEWLQLPFGRPLLQLMKGR